MSAKSVLHFDRLAADRLIARYFEVTRIHFDAAMGKRLRLARGKLNLSQRELADKLGLSQSDIARIESGKNIAAMPKTDLFKSVLDKYFEDVLFPTGYLKDEELTIEKHKQIKKWVAYGKK